MGNDEKPLPVLRYPGGKQRLLRFLSRYLPARHQIRGRYVEPFVGGASVFLFVSPTAAILSDSNRELMDLYEGIRAGPANVWRSYESYPPTKREYHRIRSQDPAHLDLFER